MRRKSAPSSTEGEWTVFFVKRCLSGKVFTAAGSGSGGIAPKVRKSSQLEGERRVTSIHFLPEIMYNIKVSL